LKLGDLVQLMMKKAWKQPYDLARKEMDLTYFLFRTIPSHILGRNLGRLIKAQ
jgi:spore coat protein CotF